MDTDVLSNLIIDKIDSVSTIYTEENASARRRNRQRRELVIKYEGETRYTSNGKDYISNINHIALLPKGCDYDWICEKAGHFSIVEFECEKTCPTFLCFLSKAASRFIRRLKNGNRKDFERNGVQTGGIKRFIRYPILFGKSRRADIYAFFQKAKNPSGNRIYRSKL